jgi:hypothetical protein
VELRLTPEQIYNANNSSLKDAIVALVVGFVQVKSYLIKVL